MEKFSFFDDVNDDRVYFAEDFARHLAKFFTNGIFNNGCQVIANNDMTVTVKTGSANINGYRYDNDSDKILTVENADGVANRVDNIVIRLDLINRTINAMVIKGTFNEEAIAPDLVRNSTTYDLRIAKISIPAGTATITQDLIEDTRLITSDCGNVIAAVETPDTENLYIQLRAIFDKKISDMDSDFTTWFDNLKEKMNTDIKDLEKFINDSELNFNEWKTDFERDSETDFNEWFNTIKNKLGSDVAGQLQNQIDNIVNNLINYYKKTETYSKDEINEIVKATINIKKVDVLPSSDIKTNTIYLVPKSTSIAEVSTLSVNKASEEKLIIKANAPTSNISVQNVSKSIASSNNSYDEYIYVDSNWEMIGSTEVDLSDYITTQSLNDALKNYVSSTALDTKLQGYVKTTQLPTKVSQLENDMFIQADNEEDAKTKSAGDTKHIYYWVEE